MMSASVVSLDIGLPRRLAWGIGVFPRCLTGEQLPTYQALAHVLTDHDDTLPTWSVRMEPAPRWSCSWVVRLSGNPLGTCGFVRFFRWFVS